MNRKPKVHLRECRLWPIKPFSALFFISFCVSSCKKMIQIPLPVGAITTSAVFENNEQAVAAISDIYFQMINSGQSFASYNTSIFAGLSSDELKFFPQAFVDGFDFERNTLRPNNVIISNNLWAKTYSILYVANAIIEGLEGRSGVTDSVKSELIGEAKFVRAFCNFYLVNLFGDIPLMTTTNWHKTNLVSRTAGADIYQIILSDLKDAEQRLPSDYSVGKGERIIPNKWAAKALLARTYLYRQDWINAESQASSVINNAAQYFLTNNLNGVFLKNSGEAIWQLKQSNLPTAGTNFNATPEGALIVPRTLNSSYPPYVFLSSSLLGGFESGDQRLAKWVDSTKYNGVVYYFPYKYKIGPGQAIPNGPYSEYYMVLRLAEQYLIRAEAKAMQNKLSEAINDLNMIRKRAALPYLSNSLTQQQILDAVAQERKIELFCEWGHRWMDLKRTGKADDLLRSVKGSTWRPSAQLYPIPLSELATNPNLTQNVGY